MLNHWLGVKKKKSIMQIQVVLALNLKCKKAWFQIIVIKIKPDFINLSEFQVLYMSFDKFLLAVESRDLSQADKSIIRGFFTFLIAQAHGVPPTSRLQD